MLFSKMVCVQYLITLLYCLTYSFKNSKPATFKETWLGGGGTYSESSPFGYNEFDFLKENLKNRPLNGCKI
jgi:hypothetical protein